jgi:hypothetical protein
MADWTKFVTHPITPIATCDQIARRTARFSARVGPLHLPATVDRRSGGTIHANAATASETGDGDDDSSGDDSGGFYGSIYPSGIYGGYEAWGHQYKSAEGDWTVPYTQTTSQSPTALESMWVAVGYGDAESDPLVQGGTWNSGVAPNGKEQLWWEVACNCANGNNAQFVGAVDPGTKVHYEVDAHQTTDTFNMFITRPNGDQAQQIFTYNKMTATFAGNTAWWISERPTYAPNGIATGTIEPLAKFGTTATSQTMTMAKAMAKAPGLADYTAIADLDHDRYQLMNCANTSKLQNTDSLGSDGKSFTLTWLQYGQAEPYATCPD